MRTMLLELSELLVPCCRAGLSGWKVWGSYSPAAAALVLLLLLLLLLCNGLSELTNSLMAYISLKDPGAVMAAASVKA